MGFLDTVIYRPAVVSQCNRCLKEQFGDAYCSAFLLLFKKVFGSGYFLSQFPRIVQGLFQNRIRIACTTVLESLNSP